MPSKSHNGIIASLAGGTVLCIYLLGLIPRTRPVPIIPVSRFEADPSTQDLPQRTLNFSNTPSSEPLNPEHEYYTNPNFDETQYASDHWDEYQEDPEDLDKFPDIIFDAIHD